jgi:hypothetical protein
VEIFTIMAVRVGAFRFEAQQGEAGATPALIRNCIARPHRGRAEPDYLPEFVSGALRE